ncbi:FAD-dependent oxidoreductase [Diplocloster modestus]|uniref:FAD-dependent oxidoreductase n=1 Tax=Diplocloster modestus TaxID=2850322 RepID=A0ABS6K8X6_9FIRM|nr:FAD-dependent oxidoreductase [Diplocloster modestus]MBU9726968.1 FAD-dependent oxidoreductase [Diplocloster modestus]
MDSLWIKNSGKSKKDFPVLDQDLDTEAVVIGAGIAGILTAYHLVKQGIKVVVLEGNTVGSGTTSHTTAKITACHGLIYDRLLHQAGKKLAGCHAIANQKAILAYRDLIDSEQIDCGFEMLPCYLYTTGDTTALEAEYKAAASFGLPVSMVTSTELPFPVTGAIRYEDQAQFHPLQFLWQLASHLNIYEHTMATKVKKNTVYTSSGFQVHARHIIAATHYPFKNMPGLYFTRMHQERSYALAISGPPALSGMYVNTSKNGCTFRSYGDYLIIGGGNHRSGENNQGGYYDRLRAEVRRLYPEAREQFHWSAQDCITLDGLPYIGRYSIFTPDLYLATGFQEWGMTSSMVAARLLTDLIIGQPNDCHDLYLPKRFDELFEFGNFANEIGHAVRGLIGRKAKKNALKIENLENGQGGVVEKDGELLGAYRDDEGNVSLVHLRCPHLGCTLSWNPDEKSWDCPCHGTRLDCKGNIISNPAIEDLNHTEKHFS